MALQDSSLGHFPLVLCFHLGQTVTDGSNPSKKKETRCVCRYRIWHPKHESTFESDAWGRAVEHPAPESRGQCVSSPRSQPSEVGRLIAASSSFPGPALSRSVAQTWGECPGRTWPSLPSCRSHQSTETSAFGNRVLRPTGHRDTQQGLGRRGQSISLCFSPLLVVRTRARGRAGCFS